MSLKITAQASGKALSSLDQFGIGGVGTVRGYNTNEASSNSGLAASFEVSGKPIPLTRDGIFPISVSPYGFVDAGYLRPTSTSPSVSLSSIGLGGRFVLGKSASAMIEAAQSLRAGPKTKKGNTTIHFNITAQF
jgi:hemolysin activation/secretion protein